MSNSDLIRALIDAVLPEGAAWTYVEDGDLGHLYDGIADCLGQTQDYLEEIAYVRYAQRTSVLDDLERDYDVPKNTLLTEQERRDQLAAVYPRRTAGTGEELQERLRTAGFDVYVHRNNPPIDPSALNRMVWGNDRAVWGRDDAVWGSGLETYVNAVWGNDRAVWGRDDAVWGSGIIRTVLGEFLVNSNDRDSLYTVNEDPCIGFWAAIFFVGGPAERDPVTGSITSIEYASVPAVRREEFRKIIMSVKPFFTWAALILEYT